MIGMRRSKFQRKWSGVCWYKHNKIKTGESFLSQSEADLMDVNMNYKHICPEYEIEVDGKKMSLIVQKI